MNINLFDIHEFLKPIIEDYKGVVIIDNIQLNNDNSIFIFTCNTLYLTKGKVIVINGFNYYVEEVLKDYRITLTKIGHNQDINVDSFELYSFKYFHGTVKGTNRDRTNLPHDDKQTPITYFFEQNRENYDTTKGSSLLGTFPIKIFFLDSNKFEEDYTDGTYNDVIKPMRSAVEVFINSLTENKYVQDVSSVNLINETRFATFVTSNGYDKTLFDEQLSGVEVNLTLTMYKSACKCLDCKPKINKLSNQIETGIQFQIGN
jgi:hypothetical protein